MSYGDTTNINSGFSDSEKINHNLKQTYNRIQTDVTKPWYSEPLRNQVFKTSTIYKKPIPDFLKEIKDYVIVDDMNDEANPTPRIVLDSNGNPLTVELMLFTYSRYKMSDILDTSKVRNSHVDVQSTDLQDISLNGENITCFKLPSRHMFCRYKYWLTGLTGKYSLNAIVTPQILVVMDIY